MSEEKYTTKNIGRSAIWSVLNQSASQFMVLGIFLVTARFISKEDFGIMATSMLVIELFRQVVLENIGTYLLSRQNPENSQYNAGFVICFAWGAFSTLCIVLLAHPLATLLGYKKLEHALILISPLIFLMALVKIHEVWLIKQLQFKLLAIRSIVSVAIGGGIGIYMAFHDYGLNALLAQQLITASLSVLFLWINISWKPAFKTTKKDICEALNFCKYLAASSIVSFINGQSSTFFISLNLGMVATALLNAAKRLAIALQLIISSSLNTVILPILAEKSSIDEELRESYLKSVHLTALLTAPLFAGVAALSEPIILFLLGKEWIEVHPVLALMTLPAFIWSISQYNINIMLIKNKQKISTTLGIFNAISGLTIVYFTSQYNLTVLMIGTIIQSLIILPVYLYFVCKMLNITIGRYLRCLMTPAMASIIMAAIIYAGQMVHIHIFIPEYIVQIAVLVPVGVIIYALNIYVMDRKTFRELTLSFKLIRN